MRINHRHERKSGVSRFFRLPRKSPVLSGNRAHCNHFLIFVKRIKGNQTRFVEMYRRLPGLGERVRDWEA
ncbi:Hypothetical protein DEACI_3183 [Acididesulfobacillus acetoxydans]|uniref:Uncharacterized protein n=1 Tax=Acididesulfobacillus acetoxydans TaxID=1561005 RepID=A0A8S0W4L4_9FIRM|nr:Hypothetical protein DEACI_3183 [Acididesulfobacillus acetoxydans]CEJ05963.1 Hypothetical protein DEACI_0383 [Acididesulfobacillus acetoxydans]